MIEALSVELPSGRSVLAVEGAGGRLRPWSTVSRGAALGKMRALAGTGWMLWRTDTGTWYIQRSEAKTGFGKPLLDEEIPEAMFKGKGAA